MAIVSRKIRSSARDEDCTLNIVGHCLYTTETTVFCHLPDETSGMGRKSDDISGCYGCHKCHEVIDRRVWDQEFEERRDWYLRRAQTRTMRRLIEKGIVVVR